MSRIMTTKEDLRLIGLMIEERDRLKQQLSYLSNASIADKLELGHSCVRNIVAKRIWTAEGGHTSDEL